MDILCTWLGAVIHYANDALTFRRILMNSMNLSSYL